MILRVVDHMDLRVVYVMDRMCQKGVYTILGPKDNLMWVTEPTSSEGL